jgi:hypothetical protein
VSERTWGFKSPLRHAGLTYNYVFSRSDFSIERAARNRLTCNSRAIASSYESPNASGCRMPFADRQVVKPAWIAALALLPVRVSV